MIKGFNSVWISKWWFRNLLVFCLFLVIGFSVYWNSLGNSFQFDDEMVITYNKNIRTLKNVFNFFINPELISADSNMAKHYRPLVVISYAINYAIGGYNPIGYHFVNIVLHIGTAFLVFLIFKAVSGISQHAVSRTEQISTRTFLPKGGWGDYFPALAAGLIFLVHPFNSEAVNYITARFSIMSSFFYLLAFYCWVKYRESAVSSKQLAGTVHSSLRPVHYYIFSLLSFVASMLCKEIAVTLPIMFWLYDIYFVYQRSAGMGAKKTKFLNWRMYPGYLPFIGIVIIPYLLVRLSSYKSVLPPFQRDIFIQFMTVAPVLVKHWQMFFLPSPLTIGHIIKIQNVFWSFPVIYSGIILIIYISIAALLYRVSLHCWKVVSFFMFWFFVVLLPTTVIPLNAIFQENRGYLALISFAVLAGVIVGIMKDVKVHNLAVGLLLVILVVYSVVTINQNKIWKDEITLWSDAVKKYPTSPAAYTALGIAYTRAGKYDKSLEASRRALILGGADNFFVHDNLAHIYMLQEKWELVIKELELAIKGYPYKPINHNDIGIAYFKTGKMELAERHYKWAISLDNLYYQSWFNLGALYVRQGKVREAVQAYKNVLLINPSHINSMLRIGLLSEKMGEKKEAVDYYKMILQQAGKGEEELAKEAGERLKTIGE